MADYQPLFIDFSGRAVVIFGGGAVGERKAAYFTGARVTVISRSFTSGLEEMPGVRLIRRDVKAEDVPGLIEGAFLAVAATGDPELDREIARVAGNKGILINSAGGDSSVILPSKIKKDGITIAISTGGRSPAMARFIREHIEESLGSELADMVRLQEELRQAIKKSVKSQNERERLLWDVMEDPSVWKALKTSYNDAKRLALDKLKNKR